MIRRATHDDFQQWGDFCRRLHVKTPFADTAPDVETVAKLFRMCLSSKLGCVLVAEHSGRITGTIIGVAQEWWWCRKRVASDLMFYAERPGDGIALLRAFVAWGWSVPSVIDVVCGQSSGVAIHRTGLLYRRVGMKLIGGIYHMQRPVQQQEQAA